MGRSKRKTTTNQTERQFIDPDSRGRINAYNRQTDSFLSQPFQNYVQPLSDRENRARTIADQSVGAYSGLFDDAEGALRTAGNQPIQFDRTVSTDRYTNPFQDQVIDAFSAENQFNLDRAKNDLNARVALDGGYGGSGHNLGTAELEGQFNRSRDSNIANLLYQNFESALDRDFRDRSTDLQADIFNTQNQQNISQLFSNLANQRQAYDARDIGILDALGASERGIDQASATAEYQDLWQRQQQRDRERQLAGSLADRTGTLNGTTTEERQRGLLETLGGLTSLGGALFDPVSSAASGIADLFAGGGGGPPASSFNLFQPGDLINADPFLRSF